MTGGQWMAVLIVAIVMISTIMKARYNHGRHADPQERIENERLRDEVRQLKERIHVLERIATDKENTLSRQIEELRDR